VVQEGNRSIELHLRVLRAADGKVDPAQGVVSMELHLGARVDRATPQPDDHERDRDARDDTMQ
jgi:hypothetical protein